MELNKYGLKTRKAKPGEEYRAPSDTVVDPKGFCGWPRCLFLAYAPETADRCMLICGGGQTPEEAIKCATGRIERIGASEFERQRRKG